MERRRSDSKLGAWSAAALVLLLAGPVAAAPPGSGDPEICDDGIDNDGDRKVDCDDRDCRDDPACTDGGGDAGDGILYDLEALPDPTGLEGYPPFAQAFSDDRTWIAGHTGRVYPCQATAWGPTLWERDPSVGWLAHELPHPDAMAGYGYAEAVLDGGTAVGWDFEYAADCTLVRNRPLLWEPAGSGVWSALALPTPTADGGAALDTALVDGVGLVIVGSADHALLWHQVSGVWTLEDLGSLGGHSTARGVNEAGVVVGSASADPFTGYTPFIIVPEDTDSDGLPDTWFRDDLPADGVNDLMQLMGPSGEAWDVNDGAASCGDAPLATVWESDGAGGWTETTLPIGTFSDDTDVYALNDSFQAVGNGTRPKGRSVEARATLWERDGSGTWSLTDLNDVTELPSRTTLTWARGINACGDIVANAYGRDGQYGAVLTPRSSPCD